MADRIFSIYPAVGIARVGDADRSGDDFFFIGPEIPDLPPNFDKATNSFGAFKVDGKVRPQAVRFRIFEYERAADGTDKLIGEVKLGERGISAVKWTVHLANRKASFCKFIGQQGAEDKPYFKSYTPDMMRNPAIPGLQKRKKELELDPGPKTIDAGAATVVELAITQPKLKKIKTLGQLRSDPEGRLIVIGGFGFAESFPNANAPLGSYVNNPGWFDDVSDGPVTAELTVDGKTKAVEDSAWLAVGPPDFAPGVRSYRTMYDTLVDVYVRNSKAGGPLAKLSPEIEELRLFFEKKDSATPHLPSFTRHIYPIIASVSRMIRLHQDSVANEPDYHRRLNPKNYDVLGGEDDFDTAEVDRIFRKIRDPQATGAPNASLMPLAYGDYYDDANGRGGEGDPQFLHAVSVLQYALLKAWRAGNIVKDWKRVPEPADKITPDGLTRAALEGAVGGAFFPGIECGWLFTKPEVFKAPFRIAIGTTVGSIPVVPDGSPGEPKRFDLILGAGSFSQQMAQPWHADFHDCVRDDSKLSTMIAWWPVQRPDVVFVQHEGGANRLRWDRDIAGRRGMVNDWATRGFVVDTGGNLFEVDGPAAAIA
ncbi:LodA/GoxA family CTQ-dependent oxidase [Bradyrhizobium sp.]|uniref:LodA/GoxA family CTQ-dependent oxidase n=1 Tax=Bradyrhizobium sp. TaxID=376 RepID=UPI002E09FF07|nr:LodA/GoxA family CTQ-dependent oxidase [Bradyrhizobium sp.]